MRTTVEIKDEHRARLLELAAKRREKGISGVLAEAIEGYLAEADREQERRRPGGDRRRHRASGWNRSPSSGATRLPPADRAYLTRFGRIVSTSSANPSGTDAPPLWV